MILGLNITTVFFFFFFFLNEDLFINFFPLYVFLNIYIVLKCSSLAVFLVHSKGTQGTIPIMQNNFRTQF